MIQVMYKGQILSDQPNSQPLIDRSYIYIYIYNLIIERISDEKRREKPRKEKDIH